MQYRNLGKSNPKVSALCLGTMMFGDQTARDEAALIVADARAGYVVTAEDEALVDSLVHPGHPSTPGYTDPAYPLNGRVIP
jgi:hypothetical protein